MARRRNPAVNHLAARCDDSHLAFLFVQVDGTMRVERVFAMWSRSYHLTKEASRFIISSAEGTRFQQT